MAVSVPISFEFYPPKTDEQRTLLDRSAAKLRGHAPEYVSCTFGAGSAHAGQVRRRIQAVVGVQALHGFRRVGKGGSAGAERAGDVLGRLRAQLRRGPVEQRALLVGLGRVELERNRDARGHAGSPVSPRPSVLSMVLTSKPSIAACSAQIGSISVTTTRAP